MKPKRIILLFLLLILKILSILLIFLFDDDDYVVHGARIQRRQSFTNFHSTLPLHYHSLPNDFGLVHHHPMIVHRQSPILPSVFSGPLALAAFLFTLPLLPSLFMAPFAIASMPSAYNVLNSVVSGITNGRPIQSFIDPFYNIGMHSSSSSSSLDNQTDTSNQPIRRQLNMLRSLAKTVRFAMNKRYSSNQIVNPQENPIPAQDLIPHDIPQKLEINNQIEELLKPVNDSMAPAINSDTNNNNDLVGAASSADSADSGGGESSSPVEELLKTASQMEKSIRGMDILYTSLRDIYSVIRNGLRRYEITDSECQSRIVCEIHQKIISRNKLLKTFSLNVLDVLNLEKHVDSWNNLNQKSKESIKFYINAAKVGFADKDCNREFRNCPTLNVKTTSRHLRKMILSRNGLLNLII